MSHETRHDGVGTRKAKNGGQCLGAQLMRTVTSFLLGDSRLEVRLSKKEQRRVY